MSNICKVCKKEYNYNRSKGHSIYICNTCRQDYRKKIMKHRAVLYKGGKCSICGYDKCEEALEFHHINPEEKEFTISKKYNLSWNKIQQELDKCIMLCSVCHKEIHAKNRIPLQEYQKWITPQQDIIVKAKIKKDTKESEYQSLIETYNSTKENIINSHVSRRKTTRLSYDQFKKEFEELNHNYSAMGRKYGVCDNTIRKWIKSYEKYGF